MQNMDGVTEPVLLRGDYYAQRIGSGNLEILTLECLKTKLYNGKIRTIKFLF